MPEDEAFVNYKTAPLALRRKIAMLGLIHKCATGQAPVNLCKLFERDTKPPPVNTRRSKKLHPYKLVDRMDGNQSSLLARSIYGLVRFYNVLPEHIVRKKSVRNLQGYVQSTALKLCKGGMPISAICSLEWF